MPKCCLHYGVYVDVLRCMQVNLDTPNLRLLNIDPPVFVVDDFATSEMCEAFIQAASAPGENQIGIMQESGIGGGSLGSTENIYSSRRTSTSLLLDIECLKKEPVLKVQDQTPLP